MNKAKKRGLMMVVVRITVLSLVFFWGLVSSAWAQPLSGEEVLAHLRDTLGNLQDASFTLTGRINDDPSEYEVEFQAMLDRKLVRATFLNPLSVADNIFILDDQDVYNYYFLTDQVTIFKFGDPKAFGHLLVADLDYDQVNPRLDPKSISISYDISELLIGWSIEVIGYGNNPAGSVYQLELQNPASGPNDFIGQIRAEVVEGSWYPTQIEVFLKNDTDVFKILVQDFVTDQGLDPNELRSLPIDAEVIDGR
ncbi:MAG: hypothetical protein JSV66_01780 [Trueperaceae bacterium]|nr:MAG: hypothetical protein JSV66_01780 [Trueperaceae bacterium]